MTFVTLIRAESAGFAYSAYEKIIKLEMRKLQDGWSINERAGTKGGTLRETVDRQGMNFNEADRLLADRLSAAKRAGFVIVCQEG